ncbi:unnamed protein product [Symbiodinium sp. CCMP2592]|nr:unnamed protein product [Symbiodinium sp. CCMP2592]
MAVFHMRGLRLRMKKFELNKAGTTAAAAALAVQLCVLERAGKGSKELEKNEDKTLTFREEDGLTKLVPLIPEPHADRKQALCEGLRCWMCVEIF